MYSEKIRSTLSPPKIQGLKLQDRVCSSEERSLVFKVTTKPSSNKRVRVNTYCQQKIFDA